MRILAFFCLSFSLFLACGPKKKEAPSAPVLPEGVQKKGGISLFPVGDSPNFPQAELRLKSFQVFSELVPTKATFELSGFELGKMTEDTGLKGLAFDEKGQHLTILLNNKPFQAVFDANMEFDLPIGHYVMLAFPSRSYYESVKVEKALVLKEFSVGKVENVEPFDADAPHIFFNRPRGQYEHRDAEKILVDFYMLNVDLSKDGYKVEINVNGTAFVVDRWQAYSVSGLGRGMAHSIRLTLLDADGRRVKSPFNPAVRSIRINE